MDSPITELVWNCEKFNMEVQHLLLLSHFFQICSKIGFRFCSGSLSLSLFNMETDQTYFHSVSFSWMFRRFCFFHVQPGGSLLLFDVEIDQTYFHGFQIFQSLVFLFISNVEVKTRPTFTHSLIVSILCFKVLCLHALQQICCDLCVFLGAGRYKQSICGQQVQCKVFIIVNIIINLNNNYSTTPSSSSTQSQKQNNKRGKNYYYNNQQALLFGCLLQERRCEATHQL